jgi:hypothetical protein
VFVAEIEPLGKLIGALLEVSAAPIPHRHGVKLDEQPHRFGGGGRLSRPFELGSFGHAKGLARDNSTEQNNTAQRYAVLPDRPQCASLKPAIHNLSAPGRAQAAKTLRRAPNSTEESDGRDSQRRTVCRRRA